MLSSIVAAIVLGCASAPAVRSSPEPFACRGRAVAERPPPSPWPPMAYEPARLRITRDGASLDVIAENVPLGALAIALAERGRGSIRVHPALAGAPVALRARGVAEDELLRRIATDLEARVHVEDGGQRIEPIWWVLERERRRRLAQETSQALEIRLVPVDRLDPRQLAAAYCEMVASPRGSAVVVGRSVLIRDVLGAHERFEELLLSLERDGSRSPPLQSAPVTRR